ncbi:Putative ABC transporter ATP-binding protein MG015 [Frankliniella fusca]|uniref:ABC transporter ATP-binding protein MG015 n=1 Tax=Frankliniella fusca TaxID=407009 RepID=A0AAE1LRD9_9NEOP|nr:Putative ABC transporter ATP-binding protein MG015 [Frankliniella fusca]
MYSLNTKHSLNSFCDDVMGHLKIIHLNAQSLMYRCHADEFIYLFDGAQHDIISVSETFFNKPSDALQLQGYNVFISNRTSHDGDSRAVIQLLDLCNLVRVPFGPTYHAGTVHSSLDMIASTCQDKLVKFIQIPVCGLSAHDLLYAAFNIKLPKFKSTYIILIGNPKILNKLPDVKPNIVVNGMPVPYLDTVNNLGLTIDCNLTWEKAAEITCSKSIAALHSLRRNKDMLPTSIRKYLVECLIFPILDYCQIVTFGMLFKAAERLQKIQNACARFIFDVPRDAHISPFLNKLNWLSIAQRRNFQTLCLLKKVLLYKSPVYLCDKFTFVSEVHDRRLREHKHQLRLPIHSTDKERGSFWVASVILWNQLPSNVLDCNSFLTFKSKLTKHMLSTNLNV